MFNKRTWRMTGLALLILGGAGLRPLMAEPKSQRTVEESATNRIEAFAELNMLNVLEQQDGHARVELRLDEHIHVVNLKPYSIRSDTFRVMKVGQGEVEPPAPSVLIGSLNGDSESVVLASRRADGLAVTVIGSDGSVYSTDTAMAAADASLTTELQCSTMAGAHAGGQEMIEMQSAGGETLPDCPAFGYIAQIAIDTDYASYVSLGEAGIVSRVEWMVAYTNVRFRDAIRLRMEIAEIRIRATAEDDPYLNAGIVGNNALLNAITTEWGSELSDGPIALVAYPRGRSYSGIDIGAARRGGVGTTLAVCFGFLGTTPNTIQNAAGVLNHEIAHVWGARHCVDTSCGCSPSDPMAGAGHGPFNSCTIVEMSSGLVKATRLRRLTVDVFESAMRVSTTQESFPIWGTTFDIGTLSIGEPKQFKLFPAYLHTLRCQEGCMCAIDAGVAFDAPDLSGDQPVELDFVVSPSGQYVDPSSFVLEPGQIAGLSATAYSIWPGNNTARLSYSANNVVPNPAVPGNYAPVVATYFVTFDIPETGVVPGSFSVIGPANGLEVPYGSQLTLSWEHSYGATHYTINAWETLPGDIERPFELVKEDVHRRDEVGITLCSTTTGATYRWQVVAKNATGSTIQMGSSRTFTVTSSSGGPCGIGPGGSGGERP